MASVMVAADDPSQLVFVFLCCFWLHMVFAIAYQNKGRVELPCAYAHTHKYVNDSEEE